VTVLTTPTSSATIDLPEDLVKRYEAAGWTQVEKPKPATSAKK
jgi:hypothetical protein